MGLRKNLRKTYNTKKTLAKKRYTNKAGGIKLKQVGKDIMMLKRIVNVEKKFLKTTHAAETAVGQVQANTTGALILDITPKPAQGIGVNQFTGHSFKLTGVHYEMQLKQQGALNVDSYYTFEIFAVVGTPDTTANILSKLFDTSTFTSIIDSYSARNQDSYSDFRLIKRWVMKMPSDQVDGTNIVTTKQFALRLDKHIRCNSAGVTSNGQMIMVVRGNYGNCSTATDSTLSNLGTSTANTGVKLNFASKYWYVDN